MGGVEQMAGGEQFNPDFSFLGALKQKLWSQKLVFSTTGLLQLGHGGTAPDASREHIRKLVTLAEKMQKWDRIEDFLNAQGPLSDDDPLQFALTDEELERLFDYHLDAYPETFRKQQGLIDEYKQEMQNPLALQITQFYRVSKKIFKVPADRQKQFEDSDYRGIQWKDMIFPHKSFAVEFDPPRQTRDANNEPVLVSGIIINRLHDLDPAYSENAFQIRAIVANSADKQRRVAALASRAKENTLVKKHFEKACRQKIKELSSGKEIKDKTDRKFDHWFAEFQKVQQQEMFLFEKPGATVEVDLDSPISVQNNDPFTAQLLKILAGTCLYVANSTNIKPSGGASEPSGPRDFEVATLQSTDKEHPLKPMEMLETARSRLGSELVDPHPRREHERTYHRGTPKEFKIKIDETIVVGKRKVLPKAFTFGVTTSRIKSEI